jgi:hypothetical protein
MNISVTLILATCYRFVIKITLRLLYPQWKNTLYSLRYHHHHHKHQWSDPLIRSVSTITTALANVSSVYQFFFFLVVCSDIISKGFGLLAFFATVKSSSVCIHPSCPVCIQSAVHGVQSRLFCGLKGCSLPEVSITPFLPLQFFVSVRLFLTDIYIFIY